MMTTQRILRQGWLLLLLFTFIPGNAQYNFSKIDQLLDSKQAVLGGNVYVIITKDNKPVYTYQKGDYTENTPELIASCSKWLTAALVMTFVDEGKLSLEDPVGKYLPAFSSGGKEKILLKHCLSHTTGIESEHFSIASVMDRRKLKDLGQEVNEFAHKPMVGEPGKVFAYSSTGLNTAAHVLEVISGKSFETLFQERIAKPLGMNQTTFNSKQVVNPSGGATSTASDYMKFLEMLLNLGQYHGKRILSEKAVLTMQESRTLNAKVIYTPEQAEGLEYGSGEWIHRKNAQGKSMVVSSPGLFGSFPCISIPGNYAVMVFVKNLRTKGRREFYNTLLQDLDEILIPAKPN